MFALVGVSGKFEGPRPKEMHVSRQQPKFLIIGSQKAGTSSLWNVLRQHPQLFLPDKKEVNFFFNEADFHAGISHYEAHFRDAAEQAICGEASPGYICHPRVPMRILRALPNVKLIVTLRDPIERAYSQYWDNRRWLSEGQSFDDLVRAPLHQVFVPGQRNYFSRGLYSIYLQRYFALFDRSQILTLWFSDFKRDPETLYRKCFEFLGVDQDVDLPSVTDAVNYRSIFKNPFYRFFFHRPRLASRLPNALKRLLRFGGQVPYTPEPVSAWAHERLRAYYAPYDRQLEVLLDESPPWLNADPASLTID